MVITPMSNGRPSNRGPLQDLHDRPDRVVLAHVMIEPDFVEPLITVASEKFTPRRARSGTSAQRPSTNERRSSIKMILDASGVASPIMPCGPQPAISFSGIRRVSSPDQVRSLGALQGEFRQSKHLPLRVRRISRRASSNHGSYGVGR